MKKYDIFKDEINNDSLNMVCDAISDLSFLVESEKEEKYERRLIQVGIKFMLLELALGQLNQMIHNEIDKIRGENK